MIKKTQSDTSAREEQYTNPSSTVVFVFHYFLIYVNTKVLVASAKNPRVFGLEHNGNQNDFCNFQIIIALLRYLKCLILSLLLRSY